MSKQKNCRFIASTIGIVKSVVNNLNRRLHAVIEVLMSTALRGDNTLHPKSVGHLVELMEAKRGKRNTLNHGGCRGDYTTDTILKVG